MEGLVTGEYLCGKLEELSKTTILCCMDVKSVLKHVKLTEASKLFDVGIGVYLLNPLKSSYTFDDVAKEYLDGKLLPTREDLLGKDTFRTAWEKSLDSLGSYACYVAYTVLASRAPIEKALHETEMWKVYTEIELPLVFTLDSMEKWGICVRGEELKNYGEKLSIRIHELEKLIWEQAGEEFNINSPKQLGVILFEKLGLPGGKKTKTGYSTAADILDKLAPDHAIVKFGQDENGAPVRTILPSFEELGLQYLSEASSYPLIVLDECGRLEQKLPRFRARVLELLDGDTPILGVMRQDAMGWLEDIRNHPKVQLITVTEQNRNDLPLQLAEYYAPFIKPIKEE